MSKTPNYDAKVKAILDATKPGEKTCQLTGDNWYMDENEIEIYRKYKVPPSKYAPLIRMKLIHGYFVMFDMWYNKHPQTGEPIISCTHPSTGINVLPDKEWFTKDFIDRGRDIDLESSFFDQIYKLSRQVPLAACYNYIPPENSLAFISLGDKDSFFVLACKSKRCYYCMNGYDIENSAELALVYNVQSSYNIVHSERIHNCKFVREGHDCLNSSFLFDCRNCEYCFGATNKRNRKYLFWNEQLSKDEWEHRVAEVDLSFYKIRRHWEEKFRELVASSIWPENFNLQTENSTGEYLTRTTNVYNSYYVINGCRDLDHISYAFSSPSHDCHYAAGIFGACDNYYGVGYGNTSGSKFCLSILSSCLNMEFCNSCFECENCFGCFGLRHKKFCILNKQYTEDEYWQKVDQLKCAMLDRGEYGDFPPMYHSTQYWSGSGASIIYGATQEECQKFGCANFAPGDDGAEGPEIDLSKIELIQTIPDRLDETNIGSLSGKPFRDEIFNRRFGYLKSELAFYQKMKIAPPRQHPTRRIQELYAEMNLAVCEEQYCQKCKKEIMVAKNKNYTERIVYCRDCYFQFLEQNG